MTGKDEEYLQLLLLPIYVCAQYKPKLGQGQGEGLGLVEFQTLYQGDPFYNWLGLDNPLMYAAHKAAGGMTSIYRQIGIGGERLFRQVLQDQLGLTPEQATWSYTIPVANGKDRTLYLDGRIEYAAIADAIARERFREWVHQSAAAVGVAEGVYKSLAGAVFEVRQGYKSKDSKRQNADIANAATAYVNSYLPCAVILSNQIDGDIQYRYRANRWAIVTGTATMNDPMTSTYAFMKDVIGYDLAAFFERNTVKLRAELDAVLKALLEAQ